MKYFFLQKIRKFKQSSHKKEFPDPVETRGFD